VNDAAPHSSTRPCAGTDLRACRYPPPPPPPPPPPRPQGKDIAHVSGFISEREYPTAGTLRVSLKNGQWEFLPVPGKLKRALALVLEEAKHVPEWERRAARKPPQVPSHPLIYYTTAPQSKVRDIHHERILRRSSTRHARTPSSSLTPSRTSAILPASS
jgi:hypothetical protein